MNKKELRQQFLNAVDTPDKELGVLEVRDYNVGTGGAGYDATNKGADSVPLTISDVVLEAIDHNAELTSLCNVINVVGTHRLVLEAEAPTAARLVAEGASIATVDSEFTPVELGAYKYGEICKFTREVAEDTNFNIVAHAAQRLGTSFAKAFEEAIVTGTGVNQPQGLAAATYPANPTLNDAKKTAIPTADGALLQAVTEAYYKLPHEVRSEAIFLAHPDFVARLATLEDGNGRALLVPSYTGEFHTIFGKRIVESYHLGATGQPKAMFVNLKEAITVGLRQNVNMRQLNELYAANDMVAILGTVRFDCKLVKQGAISALVE